MIQSETSVGRFFEVYSRASNEGNISPLLSYFADPFLSAGPQGAQCVSAAEFAVVLPNRKQLFDRLAELHPEIGPHLQEGVAVAIDGQIYQDSLLETIGPDSEVFILPQIAGGCVADI